MVKLREDGKQGRPALEYATETSYKRTDEPSARKKATYWHRPVSKRYQRSMNLISEGNKGSVAAACQLACHERRGFAAREIS